MPRRTHASQNPPAQGAGTDPIDVVAGEPPVPLTVWRTPAGVGQASISPRLADRLIAAYSQPGEAVVDLTDDHALAGAATAGGRRHHPGWFTDTSALVIGPPTPRPSPVPDAATARPGRRRRRGEEVEPAAIAAWFGDDLTDPHLPPSGTTPTAGTPTLRGSTSLLSACWPLHPTRGRHQTRLRWLLHAGVALLRPGGCLVLVVRGKPGTAVPAAPQDYGPLVDAAADAGLGYLQHIVAVHADVDPDKGDRFTYYATEAELQALTSGDRAVAHLPVHADLLVFTPRQHPPALGASTGGGVRG